MREGLKVNGPFRGGKHSIFEGGFRVPFLVRWPGKVPAGTVCDETIGLVDLLATVAAVVGQKLPSAGQAAEDSYNVLPALLGQPHESPLRPHLIVHSDEGNFAIRQGPWKYIEGKPHAAVVKGERPRPLGRKSAPPNSSRSFTTWPMIRAKSKTCSSVTQK